MLPYYFCQLNIIRLLNSGNKLAIMSKYEETIQRNCKGNETIQPIISVIQLCSIQFSSRIPCIELDLPGKLFSQTYDQTRVYKKTYLDKLLLSTSKYSCLMFNSCIFIVISMYFYCVFMCLHRASWHSSATLTEVFPCFFLSCKANARVKSAKKWHGPNSSKMFVLF